jgi:hypothetical protein
MALPVYNVCPCGSADCGRLPEDSSEVLSQCLVIAERMIQDAQPRGFVFECPDKQELIRMIF